MRRLGSRVTIIDHNDRLVPREDDDIAAGLTELCAAEGIELALSAELSSVEGTSGKGVKLQVRQGGAEIVLEGTDLLVAAGRTPNTEGIGLELAGVDLTERGYIKVNE